MAPTGQASTADQLVTQRARLRTMLGRRRRFWRRAAVFAAVTIVMVLVTLVTRDRQHRREMEKQATTIAAGLQERYELRGHLPLRFPDLASQDTNLHERYYFNTRYADQRKWRRRVGVCCLRQPLRFYVTRAGRAVVLLDGERFSAHWMGEPQFRAEAAALGFESLLSE